jgi:hypothetical protein
VAVGRLPNLLVAGVPKAGTGSLFAYLTQHPEICRADQKEIGFLNYYNPLRHQGEPPPLESYMEHFAGCGQQRYAIDATPTYSYGGRPVIEAAQRLLPQPKVIITLRNPVDRLWSAYTFQRTLGNITDIRSFDHYLDVCEQRKRHASDLRPRDHLHGLYIGFYADFIGDWLDAFGDDVRVIFTDGMQRDTSGVMSGIFSWLDIDTDLSAFDLHPRNKTQHSRSPRLAKLVFSAKRSADRLGRVHPAVRRPLRRVYERLNAGELPEHLTPERRRRVEEIYRDSNETTARMLASHGYSDLPGWLQGATLAD